MEQTIKVKTNYSDGMIEQITYHSMTEREEQIAREIIQLRDKGVREALIKLGWTPPEMVESEREIKERLSEENQQLKEKIDRLESKLL